MSFVHGLETLLKNFGKVEIASDLAEPVMLEHAGEKVRDAWVQGIESEGLVKTGRYRDSIQVDVQGGDGTVGTDVPYAGILEYGDSRQAAHPVAQRALDEQGHEAIDAAAGVIREVLR